MIPINEKKRDIDIVNTITSHGTDLKRAGGVYKGLCPFHAEKTPSFVVSQKKQRFHCFGCNESGDVIDFIKLRLGLDFQGAIRHLGIANEEMTAAEKKQVAEAIQKSKRSKALAAVFDRWQSEAISHYCMLIRATCRATAALTPENLESHGGVLDPLAKWGYYIDILTGKDDEQKFALFEWHLENKIEITRRNRLFCQGFDYNQWLKDTT